MEWLILCVTLTRTWDAQIFTQTLFLGVSVRVFLDEIDIRIDRMSKEYCLPNLTYYVKKDK